jgi:hypothetical protein
MTEEVVSERRQWGKCQQDRGGDLGV